MLVSIRCSSKSHSLFPTCLCYLKWVLRLVSLMNVRCRKMALLIPAPIYINTFPILVVAFYGSLVLLLHFPKHNLSTMVSIYEHPLHTNVADSYACKPCADPSEEIISRHSYTNAQVHTPRSSLFAGALNV